MHLSVIFTLVLAVVLNAEAARILGVFHFHSRSHHILGSALLKALAAKGHQVTMVSPYPLKTPVKNYEDIELTGMLEHGEKFRPMQVGAHNMSMMEQISRAGSFVTEINEMVLNHTDVQKLLNSGRKFDLVILNWFFNDCFLAIADHFKAPVVVFSSFGASAASNKITQNPNPYSYVPFFLMAGFSSEMTFFQRVGNVLMNVLFEILEHNWSEPLHEASVRQFFPSAPPLQEMLNNVSLVLLNTHFSTENPRPYVPGNVQVGGLHVEDPQEVDADLKKFLDGAKEGVLFFSLGSNLRIGDLSQEKLGVLLETFERLPVKVLWKCEVEKLPKLPSNVKIGKWLPQREILAHPNTKVFVTHGGLLSTTEAIYFGVPIVGMPFFADQLKNMASAVTNGYAVGVDHEGMTTEVLTNAILEVLNNPSYRENIKIRSLALRDQPMKPMDTAIFWVEYVLRHKGAPHLKSSAVKLRWYQYYLLDVLGFIAAVLFASLFIVYRIIRLILRLILGSKGQKSKRD